MSAASIEPTSDPAPASEGGGLIRRFDSVGVGVIAVIFLTEAAIGVLLIAVNAQYPQAKLGAGVSLTGWALSFYFGSKVVGQPLSGWLADRTDPRRVLIGGSSLATPAIVLMGRLHSQVAYVALWTVF
ncbi:MAG: MFS transporter, partial [Dehalococcoidia bacterium]